MISQIEHYIYAEKGEKNRRGKFVLTGTISCIQEKWQTRKIEEEEDEEEEEEEEAERLQKADQNNMRPIWGYQIRLRTAAIAKNIAID